MAHILYIHQYFKTPEEGGAIRSYRIAEALVQAGHRVSILTAHNHAHRMSKVIMPGVTATYLPVPYGNEFSFYRRIWSFFAFFVKTTVISSRASSYDICYASSTPLSVGLSALVLKKTRSIPYIFEARDWWPEVPIQLGYLRNPIIIKILRVLEKSIYRNASALVALSAPVLEHMQKTAPGVLALCIPNMAGRLFAAAGAHKQFSGSVHIMYAGTIGPANGLDFLPPTAAAIAKSGVRVKWTIAGEGARLQHLKQQINELNLAHLFRFKGHLSSHEVKELLSDADFSLVSFAAHPILETCSPNKFYDALAAGVPVLINIKGHLAHTVEKFACGAFFDRDESTSLINILERYANDEAYRRILKAGAGKAAAEFDETKLTGQLVHFLASATKAG